MKQQYMSRLRQERERRGWSRNYVAEQTEVDIVTVGRWERGERLPHPVYRQKLCTLFEMNAQDLGLLPANFPESTEKITTADVASYTPDSGHDIPVSSVDQYTLDATKTVASSSEHISAEKNKLFPASLSGLYTRRALLIGLGGTGIAAMAGAGLMLSSWTSSSSPVHISAAGKPFQQFLDAITANWINRLSWSPDESYIAAATGTNFVSIWDRAKGNLVRYYQTPNLWVNDVAWSKTNWIAISSADYHNGSLEIWSITANKPTVTLKRPYSIRSSSWSTDGSYLAFSGHSPTAEVWNASISRQISSYADPSLGTQGGISRVRWSPTGNLLTGAADDGTVHVWEALTGQGRLIYRKHQSRVIDVVWSPDGQYIASASADKTVRVWEALSGRTICVYQGHTDQVEGVDWSLHGKYIVSGGKDQTAQIWEALTGKLIISYKKLNSIVETTLWSRDGTMVALGTNTKGIEIWKVS